MNSDSIYQAGPWFRRKFYSSFARLRYGVWRFRRGIVRVLLGLLLVALAFALQQPQPIPPTDDESHAGQPAWCQSHDDTYVHNCDCKAGCEKNGGGESSKCKVYCRKSACRCKSPCATE